MNITGFKDSLLSDKVLTINPELAVLVGINSAHIICQIEYWLKRYRDTKSQDHYMDERWWVYNTYEQWQKGNFPWMNKRTIMRAFNHLRDQGLIIMREHENFKKGIWATINYDKLNELIASRSTHQDDEDRIPRTHQDDEGRISNTHQDDEVGTPRTHHDDEGGIPRTNQDDEGLAVPEITIHRIHNSAKADNPPEAKPAVQNLMKERAKKLAAPKVVEEVAPKARDVSGTALVQAVLEAFNVKEFRFSARLSDRLGKPITVQVDGGTFKYDTPVDLYDNDPAFRAFIQVRLEQLKNVPSITVGTAFQNLVNFEAKPTEERPNRLYGYHHWKKMNAHLLVQRKPKEVVTVAPLPEAYDDTLI